MAPCRGQSASCLERFNQVVEPVCTDKYRTEKCAFWIQPFSEKAPHAVSLFAEPDRSCHRLVALVVVPLPVNGNAGMGPDRNGWPYSIRIDNEVGALSETAKKRSISSPYPTAGIRCHGDGAYHWAPDCRLAVTERTFVKIVSISER